MQLLPIRLSPGVDLRRALENAAADQANDSAFVVAGIGSLTEASLRYAGEAMETRIVGHLEKLSLSGPLRPSGAHLHMSVSDALGQVFGGQSHGGGSSGTPSGMVAHA